MKIISGKYKGRILKGYMVDGTRPTMDRVKESVFAMIQDYIKDSIFLDLYSGSGNIGIEAISNGSKKAYLVDNNMVAIKTIKENINALKIDNIDVIKEDAVNQLNNFINYSEMLMPTSNYWNVASGTAPGEMLQDEEGTQIMRVLGKNMAWLMKLVEYGKDAVKAPEQEEKKYMNFIR